MITYSRLWLLLHPRGYSPRDIIHLAGISESTYRKMSRNEPVRMDVLERICAALHVDIGDVCGFQDDERIIMRRG
jgi:DNA-binding Xre family transcriptional regulator